MREKTDVQLKEMAQILKERVQNGEKLDHLIPEAYALVKEASVRVTGMKHYDVQLIGGIALHEGKIAEMRTGEGKTLVATLPAFLNALSGKGVHVVTVNDYLAQRDAECMGRIHQFLGLTVGVVLSGSTPYEKKKAYNCDITYVTNTELGFDYLRDNMADAVENTVLRGLEYAIIDEVDSILIDEARTPLIISGNGKDVSKIYIACDVLAKKMIRGNSEKEFNKIDAILGNEIEETGDFIVHEKEKIVTLTAAGIKKIEDYFHVNKYSDPENVLLQHVMELALRANYVMVNGKDYIVRDDEVLIVDTFTGRIMNGRQYGDGLHQAIEAKEGVTIKQDSSTIATTTYQNFFNKYHKLCGMTGTAYTERREFNKTYHLKTVVIPTNMPVIRKDLDDVIYVNKKGKYKGVIEEIKKSLEKGQPVLVGTATVNTSEELSELLKKEGIRHQLLNAKQDRHEAEIIAKAGIHGTVTIATNMAGRGTDIILDNKAKSAGGLKVIGTERHEAKRIDDQLRGRSGRQGDPGESVFFVSMEDEITRLFAPDNIHQMLKKNVLDEDKPIDNRMFISAVHKAQKRVEQNHAGVRESVLKYDKVIDRQREMIYGERRKLLSNAALTGEMKICIADSIDQIMKEDNIVAAFNHLFNTELDESLYDDSLLLKLTGQKTYLKQTADDLYAEKKYKSGMEQLERFSLLSSIDQAWMEHLKALDYLKQDIYYMQFAQKDPVSEYTLKAFELYEGMIRAIHMNAVYLYFHLVPEARKTVKIKAEDKQKAEV